ncbi:MAG: transketolase family protein [Clostridia bacterium]|nr:transketolase family protein [Clostridia bacterium]
MSDKIATREAYGKALAELGEKYNDFIVMDADLSGSTKTGMFAKQFPKRFVNCGIAEGNMMTTAAGIATTGKKVFASSFAVFASGRAFEQIRNSIAYPNLDVKIGATHSGITVGEDGASHQAIVDMAVMRALPNMVVINPADAVETRHAVIAAYEHNGPVYIRLGRLALPVLFDDNTYKFEIGKGQVLTDGRDITVISTGLMTHEACAAVKVLKDKGISARHINMHTIKPIDKDIIISAAKETGRIITVEEHSIIGGLGSAVAEVISEECPCKLTRIGINDVFGKSGKPLQLLDLYGLTAEKITEKILKSLN